MRNKIRTAILISIALVVSGCASVNSQFDCPHTQRGVCASMTDVYRMGNNGALNQQSSPSIAIVSSTPLQGNIISPALRSPIVRITPLPVATERGIDPVRHRESVMKIWVAPFEDVDGNYHQHNVIYKVTKPGYWANKPVAAIDNVD